MISNPGQDDIDEDRVGDACDVNPQVPDADSDGIPDSLDNCPAIPNPGEELFFDPETFTVTAGPYTEAVIIVGDMEFPVSGGETIQIIQPVEIDIEPHNDQNKINLKSRGLTQVAILATTEFDPSTVDVSTVVLGPGEAPEFNGWGRAGDVNKDGLHDLIMKFSIPGTQITPELDSVCLFGLTYDGLPIMGCDFIDTDIGLSPHPSRGEHVITSSNTQLQTDETPMKKDKNNKNK